MKVVDLIKQLNVIGYDENTELTFSYLDGNSDGDIYDMTGKLCYGEDLTGLPYAGDIIDVELKFSTDKYSKFPLVDRTEIDEFLDNIKFWRKQLDAQLDAIDNCLKQEKRMEKGE